MKKLKYLMTICAFAGLFGASADVKAMTDDLQPETLKLDSVTYTVTDGLMLNLPTRINEFGLCEFYIGDDLADNGANLTMAKCFSMINPSEQALAMDKMKADDNAALEQAMANDDTKRIAFDKLTKDVNECLSSISEYDYTLLVEAIKTNDSRKTALATFLLTITVFGPMMENSSVTRAILFMTIKDLPQNIVPALSCDKNKSDAEIIEKLKLSIETLLKKTVDKAEERFYPRRHFFKKLCPEFCKKIIGIS
ncbi:MAG: hypothetical protein US49_C0001G0025 [candidate division TM6 bacterium GW2011_GWF2_37_49]|nr:MAG: hypothetical protein US49_C0001G0025 [candidate division TM6 bacterium GW2011_GWF2_37_49]